jgi:hypothetical protein
MLYSDGKVHEIRDVLPPIPVTVEGRAGEIRRTRITSWAPPPDPQMDAVLGRSEQDVAPAGSSIGVSRELVIAPDLASEEWRAALADHSLAGSGLEVDGCKFKGAAQDGHPCLRIISDVPLRSGEATERFVDVIPLLRLAAPQAVSAGVIWSAAGDAGRVSFGNVSRLISPPLIAASDRTGFLAAAGVAYDAMNADKREAIRILIDMYAVASGPDLEPSIFLAAAAMELAGHTWLSKSWLKTHPRASVRFAELLTRAGVAFDQKQVDEFARIRNKVAHGDFRGLDLDVKIEARFYGRWLLAATILAQLGYTGPWEDPRKFRIRT